MKECKAPFGLSEVAQHALHIMAQDPESNQVVAQKLGIPEKTLENKITEINACLGVITMHKSIIVAFEKGLEKPPALCPRDVLNIQSLTENEFEIAAAGALGHSLKETSVLLGLSRFTVNRRSDRVTTKLQHKFLPRPGIRNASLMWSYCYNVMGNMNPLILPTPTGRHYTEASEDYRYQTTG